MAKTFKGVVAKKDIFGGASRLVYADIGTAKPTVLSDIRNLTTGVLTAGWKDYGATDGGLGMTRGYEKETWEVDQVLAPIDEFITNRTLSIEFSIAEVGLENLQQIREGGTITTDATPTTPERTMGIGAPEQIEERMVAFLVDKRKVAGVDYVRAYIFRKAKRDGSESEHAYRKGEKTLLPVTLTCLADETETDEYRKFGIVIDQVVA